MRRLLRGTFNSLAAASLLLCLATAGLWVRSHFVDDELYAFRREPADRAFDHCWFYMGSARGRLAGAFGWSERPEADSLPPWEFRFDHTDDETVRDDEVGKSFKLGTRRDVYGDFPIDVRFCRLPDWFLFSAFAVLPAVVAFRQIRAVRRRRRRSRLALCPACGYDLRASPERCPECGQLPSLARYSGRGRG